jgi:predicted aldo/keto reductase-like oxidoreductase
MQYRKFGRQDFMVSALGFGCMRLPTNDGNPMSGNINEAESIRMIRHAIDRGVNYVDTAYPYHGGKSEVMTGRALKDGYRDRVKLATKAPIWLIQRPEDFDQFLNEQLMKLQTDRIDCYLFHALSRKTWENSVLKLGLLNRAEAAVRDGRILSIGFSFHDGPDAFRLIVDGYDKWDFCQIQYNCLDVENQAGTAGLKHAASKGLAVVVMEPLLGGRLANPPDSIRELLDQSPYKRPAADWALQWLWDQPEVSTVLSGMSRMQQVEDDLRSADGSGIHSLASDDLEIIVKVRQAYRSMHPIPCTQCGYCMPCPNGVNIPRNFELYNDGYIHRNPGIPRFYYSAFLPAPERASACIRCGECLEKCPQSIDIPEWMPKVHGVLGGGKDYP